MTVPTLSRRTLLAVVGTAGAGTLAGCSSDEQAATQSGVPASGTDPQSPAETPEDSTTADAENRIYVAPEGSDDGQGTADEPLATIRSAVSQATPGETVSVRPGEYQESFPVQEGGTAENPIEITGPPDAVVRRDPDRPIVAAISASHVHLTGLTITGLADPDRPDDPEAYGNGPLVGVRTASFDTYLEDVVVAPHAMGYSGRQLVKYTQVTDSAVGPFSVNGPAGQKWLQSDEQNHNGELVYIGTAPNTIANYDGWDEWDRTRNIRIHHVDNSEGYPHSQLVDIKPGSRNVVVEYCTDGGGSRNQEDFAVRSVALRGHQCTVRWNRLQDGAGIGIGVGSTPASSPENDVQERAGDENEIYGNEVFGFGAESIAFPYSGTPGQRPEDQAIYCGNSVDPPADGTPDAACGSDVPTTDRIGHVGGDSPWSGDSLPEVSGSVFEVDATIDQERVTVGEQVAVSATVRNTGAVEDTLALELRVGSEVVTTETVSVPAGESVQTELTPPAAPDPGTFSFVLNGEPIGEVTVEPAEE